MDLILQPPLQPDLRSQVHQVLMNRLKTLDLTAILVYRMASLVDSAVLAMAWQWDVLNPLLLPAVSVLSTQSWPGWDQIGNIDTLTNIDLLQYQVISGQTPVGEALYAQYRALILLSTALHSTMGTIGAIKNGLAGLGYPSAVVQEGQQTWGGTTYPPAQGWAVFRVLIDLSTVPAGTDLGSLQNQVVASCNFWKPARCILDSVQFQWHLVDVLVPPVSDVTRNIFVQHDSLTPAPSDLITAPLWPIQDVKMISPYYNGRYYFSASITGGGTQPPVAEGPLVINGTTTAH
jgi:hypothetical protein